MQPCTGHEAEAGGRVIMGGRVGKATGETSGGLGGRTAGTGAQGLVDPGGHTCETVEGAGVKRRTGLQGVLLRGGRPELG